MSASQRLIEAIHHYQNNLERYYKKNEEAKMLHCIGRLNLLPIEVSHLEETGVGRTVNSMRKIDGLVGDAARGLVNKWKSMVSQLEEETKTEEHKTEEVCSPQRRNYENESESQSKKRKKYDSSSEDEEEKSSTQHKEYKKRKNSDSSESENGHSSSKSEDKLKNGYREKEKFCNDFKSDKDLRKEREKCRETERDIRRASEKEAKKEAEREARKEAEREARKEAEREARKDAERETKKEAEREARKEAERQARKEAGRQAKKEAEKESKRKLEKEREAKKEAERELKKEKELKKEAEREERRRKEKELKKDSKEKNTDYKKDKVRKCDGQKKDNHRDNDRRSKHKHKTDEDGTSDDNRKTSSDEEKNHKNSDREKSSKHNSHEQRSKNQKHTNSDKKSDKSTNSKIKNPSKIKLIDDCGIDSASGATFAEALGMILPVTTTSNKRKSSSSSSTAPTPERTREVREDRNIKTKTSEPSLLQSNFKLEPLELNISSLLPTISTNYKPLNNITDLESFGKVSKPNFAPDDDEALTRLMYAKVQRTKVFSGNKTVWGKIPSLFEICTRILQDNIDALEYTGGVPYGILKPVLEKATSDQLFTLEHHNPYLVEDTDELWYLHCQKEFRNKKREELESWREMYMRCLDERDAKLKALTANIKLSQDKSIPVRQTKLAYVDSVVKPPRNIARKQVKNGIISKPVMTPTERLSTLALANGADKIAVPNPSRASTGSSSAMKPKKAPLMQKTLQLLKGRFRR